MSTTITNRIVDEAMDAYVDWRGLCLDVQRAYESWDRAPRWQAKIAFNEYQDALDREDRASLEYAFLLGCVHP
jgi:hypothetical protein